MISQSSPTSIGTGVDVDDQSETSEEAEVKAMPAFIAFKNGEKITQLLGADPNKPQMLLEKLNST